MNARDSASKTFLNSDVINDDFFIAIVERKLNITSDKFKLRLVYIEPATGNNENFVSVVYRAKISIEILETKEKKLVDVIIKALIITIDRLKEMEVFEREILMYNDVIKSFEDIYLEKSKDIIEFGPKCLKVMSEPFEVIVLDDLRSEGFEMADRKVGVGLDEAKFVFSKLAMFHAASAVRYQKDGQIHSCLDRMAATQKNRDPEKMKMFIEGFGVVYMRYAKLVKSMEGFEEIAEKIENWDPMKIMTTFMAITEPFDNGFRVLNHGDDWVNNMMFKYDENGRVKDVKFIDFQLSFWGSPANDIIYFFVSSVRDDIKIENFDNLVEHYHQELVSSLKKLKYDQPIPTLDDVHGDLLRKGCAFSFHMMLVLMIVKYDSNEGFELPQIFESTEDDCETVKKAQNNPIYKKAIATLLPFLNKRGFLDVLLPDAPVTPFMQAIFDNFGR